ncbi:MAG: sortase [Chloroflexota bacterium]
MRRIFSAGTIVPLLLAGAGVALIIAAQLDLDGSVASSLPPIPDPTHSVAAFSPTPSVRASSSASSTASPTPTPLPSFGSTADAVQLEIASVGINVKVFKSGTAGNDDFPGLDGAYIIRNASQPGRGTNSYIIGHARQEPIPLFKSLWNVQLGAEVRILMSDGDVLRYRVTEVRPNIPCPDDREPPMPVDQEPLALRYAPDGCAYGASWSQPTDHERLTLQTSQGFNRNWGEFIVIADPIYE